MSKEDGYKMHMEIPQLKDLGFNKSQIARKLKISRPTLNKYYDLSLEEIDEILESMNTRAKKADKYHDEILDLLKKHPNILSSVIYDRIEELAQGYPGFTEGTLRNYIRYLRKEHDIPRSRHTRDYEAVEDPAMGQQMQADMGENGSTKQMN